jgi:hypothetical protein
MVLFGQLPTEIKAKIAEIVLGGSVYFIIDTGFEDYIPKKFYIDDFRSPKSERLLVLLLKDKRSVRTKLKSEYRNHWALKKLPGLMKTNKELWNIIKCTFFSSNQFNIRYFDYYLPDLLEDFFEFCRHIRADLLYQDPKIL